MAGARSLAMAVNRLVDAEIDARNPRTARREIPAGLLSRMQVLVLLPRVTCDLRAGHLPARADHALAGADPGRGVRDLPYLKRFTPLCHLWLGAVDGLAPVGAWVAITNDVDPKAVPARRRRLLLDRRVRRHLRDDGLRGRPPQGLHSSRPTTASRRALTIGRRLPRPGGRVHGAVPGSRSASASSTGSAS